MLKIYTAMVYPSPWTLMEEGPSVIVREPGSRRVAAKKRVAVPDFELAWWLLLVLGWLFTIIGLLNTLLLWVPLRFGSPNTSSRRWLHHWMGCRSR